MKVLNEIVTNNGLSEIESIDDAEEYVTRLLKNFQKSKTIVKRTSISEISTLTSEINIKNSLIDEIKKIDDKIGDLLDQNLKSKLSMNELLKNGKDVIIECDNEICPLCKSDINKDDLLTDIVERIDVLEGLSSESSQVRVDLNKIVEELKNSKKNIENLLNKIQSFDDFNEETKDLNSICKFLGEFIIQLELAVELKTRININEFSEKNGKLNTTLKLIIDKCKTILDILELSEEDMKLYSLIRLIERATDKVKEANAEHKKLDVIKKNLDIAKLVYNSFSDTKKAKIQAIYNLIKEDIERYYSFIHPEEPHKNIELIVNLGREQAQN